MKDIVLLFSGQGMQRKGMGETLYREFQIAKDIFLEAQKILDFDIKELCFSNQENHLAQTKYAQIAIFVVDYIRYQILKQETKIIPSYGAGISLGEITALTCAGALTFKDALLLVRARGEFMQEAAEAQEGRMIAVQGCEEDMLRHLCNECSKAEETAVISNYNSPSQMVISGHIEVIHRISSILERYGVKVTELNVRASFHSSLMNSAAERFAEKLQKVSFRELQFPIISNVTAVPYKTEEMIPVLSAHICSPVRWYESIQYLNQLETAYYIEMSETDTLSRMVTQIANRPVIRQLHDRDGLRNIQYELSGMYTYHKTKVSYLEKAIQIITCTRNKNDDPHEYETRVKQPYRQLKELYLQLKTSRTEKKDGLFFQSILEQTVECLKAKCLSKEEIERYIRILKEIRDC